MKNILFSPTIAPTFRLACAMFYWHHYPSSNFQSGIFQERFTFTFEYIWRTTEKNLIILQIQWITWNPTSLFLDLSNLFHLWICKIPFKFIISFWCIARLTCICLCIWLHSIELECPNFDRLFSRVHTNPTKENKPLVAELFLVQLAIHRTE